MAFSARAVSVSAPYEFWHGWFHGFESMPDYKDDVLVQKPIALVEDENGNVCYVEPYKIKFLKGLGPIPLEKKYP